MIHYDSFTLKNGLRVIFHKEPSSPMAVVNVLYDVGARDEEAQRTGFAHLFEHLMFGGSVHIPDFDAPLQAAGGQSNAFTSNDITNYYDVLPAQNLDTALWLESDRMLSLAFTDKSLEVQRQVVIEEFKQRYLNQPYGDTWLHLRPLVYKKHPYQWATIGKNIKQIKEASMADVRAFFKRYYHPANAILCIVGNFELETIKQKVAYYFEDIPAQIKHERNLPIEPAQKKFRSKTLERKVPASAFYYAFRMGKRHEPAYYQADLWSDYLGNEKTSPLYIELKKKKKLVSEITAYITASLDDGLFVISGKLLDGISIEQLESVLWPLLQKTIERKIPKSSLHELKLKLQTSKAFQDQGLLSRAMNLSYFELLGSAQLINEEAAHYNEVSPESLQHFAAKTLVKSNCSRLLINPKKDA
jgi:predicted Zn-dependent peptidase